MASSRDDDRLSTSGACDQTRLGHTDAAKTANMVSNAMCYRNARVSSSSRPRSPGGLLLLDFDDIDSTNVFGYKDDRIQNDLLDEICSDIGIKDAIDLDFLDFDGATAACGAEYAAATNGAMFDDLGDLDQTIPFGQLQREEVSETRPGHVTNPCRAGSSSTAEFSDFVQQPRSCSADTYSSVMSPMSHSSCHSNAHGAAARSNLLDSSLDSIGVEYLGGGCGDAAPSDVRMACHNPPSVGSQHGSVSSVPSSPRTEYKDCKRGRTPQLQNSCSSNVPMTADVKCSSPRRRDGFTSAIAANGSHQSGFANGSSHMQYTNIQNLVRTGASASHSPGGRPHSSGSQCRPPSTSHKRSGFQCKLESAFDPGYYSVGSPSVCSGSSIMTAKASEEAVMRDKVTRYLDNCATQRSYPVTDIQKQLSTAPTCSGAGGGGTGGGGMMSSPIKLVHSQPESPQSVGHVAKRARIISSGNELLEEVRECYSYVKGADMYAQAKMQPVMPTIHPAPTRTNSMPNNMPAMMNGHVNPNTMNVSSMPMQANCRQQQQQQQMMQQQHHHQLQARFAMPRNPRMPDPTQCYPQPPVTQYGHTNMPAPMRLNNGFTTNAPFAPQHSGRPRMPSYPANPSASCNFTPVTPGDRTPCSYGAQPSASGYGATYQNGCFEKENYHGAAPCQQVPNTNFGGRNNTANDCNFFGYQNQNTTGANPLRYANPVDQFQATPAMMTQPVRDQRGGTTPFSGMHAASSMPNLAGNIPGFLSHPSGGSNPALNSVMSDFRPPHSPKPSQHQMAPPNASTPASSTPASSMPSQHGLIQRIISDQTNAFRSHSLFPLLRDLIIADMNFHSPTFPFQLIANLPTDFDKLLQNYLHRNPAAGDGRHGNQAVGKVIEDALRFAHKALIEKIRVRKEEVGYKDHVKPLSAIEAFCERFDKAVKNSSTAPNGSVLPNGVGSTSCHFQEALSDQLSQKTLLRPPMANRTQNVQLGGGMASSPRKSRPLTPHEHYGAGAETMSEASYSSGGGKCSGGSGETMGTGKNKVLPKESVAVMLAWLRQHQDNPYPNDDEKEMLIGQTKLTINQINYWFTNARRRILPKWALQRYMEQQDKQCHLGVAPHNILGAPTTNGVL